MTIQSGHQRHTTRFYETSLGEDRIIFGYPWLRTFNPRVDWEKGKVEMPWPKAWAKRKEFVTARICLQSVLDSLYCNSNCLLLSSLSSISCLRIRPLSKPLKATKESPYVVEHFSHDQTTLSPHNLVSSPRIAQAPHRDLSSDDPVVS